MRSLQTGIKEIMAATELENIIKENENVMVCCGKSGPMCIPVYDTMEELEKERPEIKFYSMSYDSPESAPIKTAPICSGLRGLPFTVYYKKGEIVYATTNVQTKDQISSVLDNYLGN